MPSERTFPPTVEQPPPDNQSKVCSSCHVSLDSSITAFFVQEPDAIVCGGCREKVVALRDALLLPTESHNTSCAEKDNDIVQRLPPQVVEPMAIRPMRLIQDERVLEHDTDISPLSSPPSLSGSDTSYHGALLPSVDIPRSNASRHSAFGTDFSVPNTAYHQAHTASHSVASTRCTGYPTISFPGPLTDITHLRVRTQRRSCLYPGASFQGTQKSGRNSYEVKVTIVVCI
jgi:hypothetical protein